MGWNSAEYIHIAAIEAMKLGYADRDAWYADPKLRPEPPNC
jgi:gamma-glutamyltranspeptidase